MAENLVSNSFPPSVCQELSYQDTVDHLGKKRNLRETLGPEEDEEANFPTQT